MGIRRNPTLLGRLRSLFVSGEISFGLRESLVVAICVILISVVGTFLHR